jgi:hypothetical protein
MTGFFAAAKRPKIQKARRLKDAGLFCFLHRAFRWRQSSILLRWRPLYSFVPHQRQAVWL